MTDGTETEIGGKATSIETKKRGKRKAYQSLKGQFTLESKNTYFLPDCRDVFKSRSFQFKSLCFEDVLIMLQLNALERSAAISISRGLYYKSSVFSYAVCFIVSVLAPSWGLRGYLTKATTSSTSCPVGSTCPQSTRRRVSVHGVIPLVMSLLHESS